MLVLRGQQVAVLCTAGARMWSGSVSAVRSAVCCCTHLDYGMRVQGCRLGGLRWMACMHGGWRVKLQVGSKAEAHA